MATGGLLSLVMVLGLTACGGGSSGTTLKADVVAGKIDGQHRFDPNKLQVAVNQDTTFSVLNKDNVVHNITVSFVNVDMDIQPGQRIEVKLPAIAQRPEAGYLTFYCKYHQTEGMSGRIEFSR